MIDVVDIQMSPEAQAECDDLAKVVFDAVHSWCAKSGREPNALYVNDALARSWAAFCGQLPDAKRDGMLERFCQNAYRDAPITGDFTRLPEPDEKAN